MRRTHAPKTGEFDGSVEVTDARNGAMRSALGAAARRVQLRLFAFGGVSRRVDFEKLRAEELAGLPPLSKVTVRDLGFDPGVEVG